MSLPRDPEVAEIAIVGGGPAGLACALELVKTSSVVVFDRRTPPLDKPCGEGLMPDGVERLLELGVEVRSLRSVPFRGIRWIDDGPKRPIEVEGRFPGRPGLGVRRTDLHAAMVRAAEARGVDLRWGTKVLGTRSLSAGRRGGTRRGMDHRGGDRLSLRIIAADGNEQEIRPRYVVAADGLRSPLRQELGLAGRPEQPSKRRYGVRRHFAVAPWTDCVEVHWGQDANGCRFEAYVTPVADDEVGVAFLWSGRKAGFDELLGELPALRRRLDGAKERSRDLGTGPLRQRVRGVVRGNVALVGDAAGYVDAITGEGLSVALHQAHELACAIESDDLSRYERRCRQVDRTARWLSELLLALQRRPNLRRHALRALQRDPTLFERFLAVHVRHVPLSRLMPLSPRLAWRLLTAW